MEPECFDSDPSYQAWDRVARHIYLEYRPVVFHKRALATLFLHPTKK
jgi:hypothetical protein